MPGTTGGHQPSGNVLPQLLDGHARLDRDDTCIRIPLEDAIHRRQVQDDLVRVQGPIAVGAASPAKPDRESAAPRGGKDIEDLHTATRAIEEGGAPNGVAEVVQPNEPVKGYWVVERAPGGGCHGRVIRQILSRRKSTDGM